MSDYERRVRAMSDYERRIREARTWGEKDRIMNERRAETLEKARLEREADMRAAEEYRRKYGD